MLCLVITWLTYCISKGWFINMFQEIALNLGNFIYFFSVTASIVRKSDSLVFPLTMTNFVFHLMYKFFLFSVKEMLISCFAFKNFSLLFLLDYNPALFRYYFYVYHILTDSYTQLAIVKKFIPPVLYFYDLKLCLGIFT